MKLLCLMDSVSIRQPVRAVRSSTTSTRATIGSAVSRRSIGSGPSTTCDRGSSVAGRDIGSNVIRTRLALRLAKSSHSCASVDCSPSQGVAKPAVSFGSVEMTPIRASTRSRANRQSRSVSRAASNASV